MFETDYYDLSVLMPGRYGSPSNIAECLKKLAHCSGGRFHRFCEKGIIESDDITQVIQEIRKMISFSKDCTKLIEAFKKKCKQQLEARQKQTSEMKESIEKDKRDKEEAAFFAGERSRSHSRSSSKSRSLSASRTESRAESRALAIPPEPSTSTSATTVASTAATVRTPKATQNMPRPNRISSARINRAQLAGRALNRERAQSAGLRRGGLSGNVETEEVRMLKAEAPKRAVKAKPLTKLIDGIVGASSLIPQVEELITSAAWLKKYGLKKLRLYLHSTFTASKWEHSIGF